VSAETLTFAALVGLPLAVAVCLGLFVRALLGGGRTWVLWLVVGVALGALWTSNVLRTP
jgi:hypothetical protein